MSETVYDLTPSMTSLIQAGYFDETNLDWPSYFIDTTETNPNAALTSNGWAINPNKDEVFLRRTPRPVDDILARATATAAFAFPDLSQHTLTTLTLDVSFTVEWDTLIRNNLVFPHLPVPGFTFSFAYTVKDEFQQDYGFRGGLLRFGAPASDIFYPEDGIENSRNLYIQKQYYSDLGGDFSVEDFLIDPRTDSSWSFSEQLPITNMDLLPFINGLDSLMLGLDFLTGYIDPVASWVEHSYVVKNLTVNLIVGNEPLTPNTPSKAIKWNSPGDRFYQTGIDQGVLYLPDGRAVPWNGLTAVDENLDFSNEGVHYDGVKISEVLTLGSFSASISAFTYPDELDYHQGISPLITGAAITDQSHKPFGLSYRTKILNDLNPDELGYKINIIYNVFAVPSDRSYSTISDSVDPTEFQWDIVAIPEHIDNYRPTSRIIIDTRKIDPLLLVEIERILYGDETQNASLIPMKQLLEYLRTWFRFQVTDNGDGTWTAASDFPEYISLDTPEVDAFLLENVNATFIADDTYTLSDT